MYMERNKMMFLMLRNQPVCLLTRVFVMWFEPEDLGKRQRDNSISLLKSWTGKRKTFTQC